MSSVYTRLLRRTDMSSRADHAITTMIDEEKVGGRVCVCCPCWLAALFRIFAWRERYKTLETRKDTSDIRSRLINLSSDDVCTLILWPHFSGPAYTSRAVSLWPVHLFY